MMDLFEFFSLKFVNPEWFYALPILIAPYLFDRRGRRHAISTASVRVMIPIHLRARVSRLRHGGWILRCLIFFLMIFTLARPQWGASKSNHRREGIDIMLAIDTSLSMQARDFVMNGQRPNRLEVVKRVIASFIDARPDDRIGMVVFGNMAFMQAPLTLDHEVLLSFLENVEIGMAGNGTSIGDGLAVAIKRVKDTPGKSHVVILLTDGANTSGQIDPISSAKAAKAVGVRVHTIGVGSDDESIVDSRGNASSLPTGIDDQTLSVIADETGGIFRKATDTEGLLNIYREIDNLERVKHDVAIQTRGNDVFTWLLPWVVFLLIIEGLWYASKFRRVPVA